MRTGFRTTFSAIILSFLAITSAVADPRMLSGPVPAFVEQVIDGDTIRVRARVWLNQEVKVLVRVNGIDAPEMRARCAKEKHLAIKVKRVVKSVIGGRKVMLTNIRRGKYAGRVIADVLTLDGKSLASDLLGGGHVRPYKKGRRKSWCDKQAKTPNFRGAIVR